MKLALGTCLWPPHYGPAGSEGERTRLEVLTLLLYARAKKKAEAAGIEVVLLAATEVPETWELTERSEDWRLVRTDAYDSLGRKHNRLLRACRDEDPDAFILIGSDDWMGPECFLRYAELAPHFEAFALSDILFAHAPTGRILEFTGPGIGVGRMVSRTVLQECDWELWDNKLNKGLDASMASHVIKRTGKRFHPMSMHDIGILAMDIKTPVNMWSFERFVGRGKMLTGLDRDDLFTIFDQDCLTELRRLYPEMKP